MVASLDIASDPTGFPMVWVEQVSAYVHWLPVTKIQFEHFLCAAPDAYFDAGWYAAALSLNPRVAPRQVTPANYWQSLMTGLQPSEAQRFASWCGDGFQLPTEPQWTAIYAALRDRPFVDPLGAGLLEHREARTRQLLTRLDAASRKAAERMTASPRLAAQMLLRHGVMEWVRSADSISGWSARGEPLPAFCGNLEVSEESPTTLAADVESARLPAAGFRLLWFPPTAPSAGSNGHPPT